MATRYAVVQADGTVSNVIIVDDANATLAKDADGKAWIGSHYDGSAFSPPPAPQPSAPGDGSPEV